MRTVVWAALASLLLASPALATGTIIGTVVDGDGLPIEGARVTLHSGDMCMTHVFTNAQGEYTFEDVDAGVYDIRACLMGTGMGTAEDVEVFDGQTTEVPPIVIGEGCGGGGGHHSGHHAPPTAPKIH